MLLREPPEPPLLLSMPQRPGPPRHRSQLGQQPFGHRFRGPAPSLSRATRQRSARSWPPSSPRSTHRRRRFRGRAGTRRPLAAPQSLAMQSLRRLRQPPSQMQATPSPPTRKTGLRSMPGAMGPLPLMRRPLQPTPANSCSSKPTGLPLLHSLPSGYCAHIMLHCSLNLPILQRWHLRMPGCAANLTSSHISPDASARLCRYRQEQADRPANGPSTSGTGLVDQSWGRPSDVFSSSSEERDQEQQGLPNGHALEASGIGGSQANGYPITVATAAAATGAGAWPRPEEEEPPVPVRGFLLLKSL